jgi:uncharacterized membrane protein YhaH (DUF805 family)
MSFKKVFSMQGRIKRSSWWKIFLLAMFWPMPLAAIFVPMAVAGTFKNVEFGDIIFPVLFIIMIGISVSILVFANIKRLHDLGRSGWLALLQIVPLANIWLFLVCACVKGESVDNKYGSALK